MTPSRPRKRPRPTHCEQCGTPLPEQVGAGRPRLMCFDCSPPNKSQASRRPRGVAPVYIVQDETRPAERDFDGFGTRGQELWDEWADKMPNPGATAVLREACRLADRAERMHRILEHDRAAWAVLKLDDLLSEALDADVPEVHVNLNVSSIVTEARQTAAALNTLVNGLRSAVRQAGAEHAEDEPEDAIASLARQMADRAPSSGNVVQMRQR